ncbi:MAG: hypothetical protein ACLU06_04510 [Eggerthellaceae bacterium]
MFIVLGLGFLLGCIIFVVRYFIVDFPTDALREAKDKASQEYIELQCSDNATEEEIEAARIKHEKYTRAWLDSATKPPMKTSTKVLIFFAIIWAISCYMGAQIPD